MIITVGLDASVEKEYIVDRLDPSSPNYVSAQSSRAGGQAVYTARVATELGEQSVLALLAGGRNGRVLAELLDGEKMEHELIEAAGDTRLNLTVKDATTGLSYVLAEPGVPFGPAAAQAVTARVGELARRGGIVILAGGPADGLPDTLIADVLRAASREGCVTVQNVNGPSFAAGLQAPPNLLAVSRDQVEMLNGKPGCSDDEVIETLLQLAVSGIEVIASPLNQQSLVIVWGTSVFQAFPPRLNVPVGMGVRDALLAGLSVGVARRWGPEETIRTSLAAAAADALNGGTGRPRLIDVEGLWEHVQVARI